MLQLLPVDVGQHVTPGTNLARVADPKKLKAEIKIAETQAKDVVIGLKAAIDTRNGIVSGHVSRIDPSVQNGTVTVDVAIDQPLPRARVLTSASTAPSKSRILKTCCTSAAPFMASPTAPWEFSNWMKTEAMPRASM